MDYEGLILAAQDAREIAEDEPDYDPALTCWCCPKDYNYENCENCDFRLWKEFINGSN